jgi:hypothetical protein
MWRVSAVLLVVFLAFAPWFAHAQDYPMDSQNPKEYTDEDSQPLKIVSYALAPLGWALEWGVARPLHYLATESFVAPALGANTDAEQLAPPNVPELPPPDVITENNEHTDTTIVPAPASAEGYQKAPPAGQTAVPVTSKPGPAQPVMH